MTELEKIQSDNRPSKTIGKYFDIYKYHLSKKYDSEKETVMM